MMNLVQGDCRCGALAFVAGENLSAATGLLVKLSAAGKVVKPGAVSDITPYVLSCGAFEGYLCGAVPLSSVANCRVALKGACAPGSLLVSSGDGRVEAGTLSGSAVPVGVAEETGVDGQHVLLRPLAVGARGADGADGTAGAAGAAGADGGVFKLAAASLSYGVESSLMVGKCVFLEAGGWTGIVPTGGSVSCFALVTGYSGGVFTCVFLGFAQENNYAVVVPTAMVMGSGAVGDTVFVDLGPDNTAVLATGMNLYAGETWTVLAVAGGATLLKKSYSAM